MPTLRSIVILLLLGGAQAQVNPGPAVRSRKQNSPRLLAAIKAKMADNLSRLPNYTCLQTIERSHREARKKRFERQDLVRLEVALVGGRELFAWPGARRIDETDLGKLVQTGVFANGNFGTFARAIFLTNTAQFEYAGETQLDGRSATQFRYRVSSGASDYRIRVKQQEAAVGYHGDFWVDAQTLDLLRLEVKADDIPAVLNLGFADNAINYAHTGIGGGDFLLPETSEIVMQDLEGNEYRNRTLFGQCHQFAGESVLSFGDVNSPSEQQVANTAGGQKAVIQLPLEFRVDASLETPLDAEQVAVGDPISVRLGDPIKRNGTVVAPKGTLIQGRVTRAEHMGDTFLLRLSFESLDFDSGHADLRGRRIHCSVADTTAPNSKFRGESEENTMAFSSSRLRFPRGFQFSLKGEPGKLELAQDNTQSAPQRVAAAPPDPQAGQQPKGDAAPPQRGSVLRSETVAVVVDVIVTDRKGHHVPGLLARDFSVYEDDAPQTVEAFTPPAPSGKRSPAKATRSVTAASATVGPAAEEKQRTPQLITLLIDLGDLRSDSLKRACQAAFQFIDRTIAAGNLVSVYWVDSSLHLGTPFTRDKQTATASIGKLSDRVPAGPFTAYERERAQDELDFSKHQSGSAIPTDMFRSWITTANALQARSVFVALRAMALAYRDLPGRKTVVVFSEGFLHALNETAAMQAVTDAANRANVAIYVIDASGMSVNSPDRSDKNNTSVEKATYDLPDSSPDLGVSRSRATAGMDQFDWLRTLGTDRHSDLGWIANATGGFLIQDTNDLGSALDRVQDDAGDYYTLVYSPSNHSYDGAFRKIKVELARGGYHVRCRRGYWAFPPGREVMMTPAAAQLLATVESGGRKPSFAPELSARLVPAGNGFGVAVAVSMPGNLVHFEKLFDQFQAAVSVLLLAHEAKGGILAIHEAYGNITLNPQEHRDFAARIFSWQGHISLPELQPVSVEAIVRFADGTIGVSERQSVAALQGPSSLRVTSLVLADQAENASCNPAPTEPLCIQGERLLLPTQPQFSRSTALEVFFGALGVSLASGANPDLHVEFRIRSKQSLRPITPKKLVATPGAIPESYAVVAVFDLRELEPGDYTLEMTAEDGVRQSRATEQAKLSVR
jgi:VWFA-related protein